MNVMKAVRFFLGMVVLTVSSLPFYSFAKNGNGSSQTSEKESKIITTDSEIATSEDLVFYVQFHLKPEFLGEFRESLLDLAHEMSKEESFVSTFLHQDPEDPNKFTIYERWNEPSMQDFLTKQLKGKAYRNYYEGHIEEWSATTRNISVLKPMKHWINGELKPSANDLAFYVNFHIKPEKVEEWKKAALHVLNSMTVEKSFVGAFLHQDASDPTKFTLYERWAEPNMEAFMKNQVDGKAYREVYEKKLPSMVASPRTFKVLKPVGFWSK